VRHGKRYRSRRNVMQEIVIWKWNYQESCQNSVLEENGEN